MKKAVIIGSGFSGCMFAMMLKEKNWDVTLVDKSNQVGGGVRTFITEDIHLLMALDISLGLSPICQHLNF